MLQSFYDWNAHDIARWLVDQGPGTVAFVWKDGEFPGDVLAANQETQAIDTGRRLAAFEDTIRLTPAIAGSQQLAFGYSWGLAATTASEVAGAHYDQVHSLAGAWMPEKWEHDPTTQYFHWSYRDFLSMAQDVGVVGGGRNPDTNDAFHSTIYDQPGDIDIPISTGGSPSAPSPPARFPATTHPVGNHELINQDVPDNYEALREIWREVR